MIQDLTGINFVPSTKIEMSKSFIPFPPAFMSRDEKYIVKSLTLLAIRLGIGSELCFYRLSDLRQFHANIIFEQLLYVGLMLNTLQMLAHSILSAAL